MRKLNYCIVATSSDNVIAVVVRTEGDKSAGLFHKLLGVELSQERERKTINTILINRDKIHEILHYYIPYQEYKEIEFLKNCLWYLKKNENVENIKISFYND
jgi:hypothetical protein